MLFNSLSFLIFFPIVTILFFVLAGKLRLTMLLAASIFFYAYFIPKFIVILFFLIGVDFFAALAIEKARGHYRKTLLITSLVANLGILCTFKYFDFFNSNLAFLLKAFNLPYSPKTLGLVLPIGLSFHTFQSMSYTIEVYRKRQKAERDLLRYSLYVLFYPQLVAGPIERPQNLLHQFHEEKHFDPAQFVSGLELMCWGFLKKVFVADRLAIFANEIFNSAGRGHSGLSAILGVYFFSFQIFCDFSGYTDIARGAARVMGFSLMENFKNPYISQSIPEFWHRWHISLSSWFRDYVYIPLGGNRTATIFWTFNIAVVFLLSGLWHGANWTFIVWGALHGFFVVSTKLVNKTLPALSRVPTFAKQLLTFNLVALAWIFFRAPSISIASEVLRNIITGPFALKEFIHSTLTSDSARTGLICLFVFALFAFARSKLKLTETFQAQAKIKRWNFSLFKESLWLALIIQIIILGAPLNESAFIYFQF